MYMRVRLKNGSDRSMEQVLELLSNYFDASEGEECDFSKI